MSLLIIWEAGSQKHPGFTWIATSGGWKPTSAVLVPTGKSAPLSPWTLCHWTCLPTFFQRKLWEDFRSNQVWEVWYGDCSWSRVVGDSSIKSLLVRRVSARHPSNPSWRGSLITMHSTPFILHLAAKPTCHGNLSKCSPPQPPWQLLSWGVF